MAVVYKNYENFRTTLRISTILLYTSIVTRKPCFKGKKVPLRKTSTCCSTKITNVIISLTAAFACSYFCPECHIGTSNRNDHRCGARCPCCQSSPPCPTLTHLTEEIECIDCNRKFRGRTCYDKHIVRGKKSICSNIKYCKDCRKTYNISRMETAHVCGEYKCKICFKNVAKGNLCFIQPNTGSPEYIDKTLFVFYDLETRQETNIANSKLHEPNLCVDTVYIIRQV